jgi:MEDS: MEthanogen/methylotroph, DcmR Sensory domain
MFEFEEALDKAPSPAHLLQFHQHDDTALIANVSRYITNGLARGSAVLIVATPLHKEHFIRDLVRSGAPASRAIDDGQLIFSDAQDTLARFMVDGHPSSARFELTVGEAVRDGLKNAEGKGLCAYGEMVGLLWQRHQFPAAIRLEQLWNKLQKSIEFDLFCSYPIDIFDKYFQSGVLDALLCAHTRLLPCDRSEDLESALKHAIHEVVGANVETLIPPTEGAKRGAWAAIPRGEATIVWLRNHIPSKADEIISRAQQLYRAATADPARSLCV